MLKIQGATLQNDLFLLCVMSKVHEFSITQILRETNFGDFRSAKSAISTHLEALNFDFNQFLNFVKAENDQKTKFRAFKNVKMAFLVFLRYQKLISRKIGMTEKF